MISPAMPVPDPWRPTTLPASWMTPAANTGREMFSLDDGTIPVGSTITAIEVFAQVGGGAGPTNDVSLSYQRIGVDPAPVDDVGVTTAGACCGQLMSSSWTGLDWSSAELDALEIGIVHNSGGQIKVSQIWVVVTYRDSVKISSATNQSFTVGAPPTAAAAITVTDDAVAPAITASGDLRIRIPAGFNVRWDAAVTAVGLTGTAVGKVTPDVVYEDLDRTVVLNVVTDFAPGDQIQIANLPVHELHCALAAR